MVKIHILERKKKLKLKLITTAHQIYLLSLTWKIYTLMPIHLILICTWLEFEI
jgi:hypothetical protein